MGRDLLHSKLLRGLARVVLLDYLPSVFLGLLLHGQDLTGRLEFEVNLPRVSLDDAEELIGGALAVAEDEVSEVDASGHIEDQLVRLLGGDGDVSFVES
jgi:hypothetical protein